MSGQMNVVVVGADVAVGDADVGLVPPKQASELVTGLSHTTTGYLCIRCENSMRSAVSLDIRIH